VSISHRRLGRSDLRVSAIGLGCNTIGGPMWDRTVRSDLPVGYGAVDDRESTRAIRRALALGINFFDTADEYGCGHSERVLGAALGSQKNQVVISSKFGFTFDEAAREVLGKDASPAHIRRACEASLRRLDRDYLDIYLLHIRDLPYEEASAVRETLEELVAEGKIRWYGWSTDDVERARFFAQGSHCAVIEHRLNVLLDAPEMLAVCKELDLGSVNRIPLLMGVLTGKYTPDHLPPEDDVRSMFFRHSAFGRDAARIEQMKGILAANGRSLAQGALLWILSHSPLAVPIPGFRTLEQVEQNAAVLSMSMLPENDLACINKILGSPL
jgi:aryl-alcohol dehydrogenase-like predicted oxidoreductase